MLALGALHVNRYEERRWALDNIPAALLLAIIFVCAGTIIEGHGPFASLMLAMILLGAMMTAHAPARGLHETALYWGTPSFLLGWHAVDPLFLVGWHAFYWSGPFQMAINYEHRLGLVNTREMRDWPVRIAGTVRNLKIFKPLVGRWRLLAVAAGLAAMTWSYIP